MTCDTTSDDSLEQTVADLAETVRNRYFGKYRGTVADADDSEHLGRIVARVPSVYGEEDSPWALPAVPFAGDGHGLLLLPRRGDGVWVEFEGGDPSRPIWTGMWWARDELPKPDGSAPAKPEQRVLVSPAGLKLVLDDDAKKLQLVHPGGAEITLTDSDITLKIGQSKIVLSSSGVEVNGGALKVSAV
jgi:uncharacterized protein involved in type VI secretion and phage assembly